MKKYVIIILSALFIIMSLSACGADQPDYLDGIYIAERVDDDRFDKLTEVTFFKDGRCYLEMGDYVYSYGYSYSSKTKRLALYCENYANPLTDLKDVLTVSSDEKTISSEKYTFKLK